MKRIFFVVLFLLLSITTSFAETYWVDDNGSAAWGSCKGVTPLSGTAACPLVTAASSAVGGDKVYLREGTYSSGSSVLNITVSGSAGNYITFENYNGEVVTLTNLGVSDITKQAISLAGVSYIKIKGLKITNTGRWGSIGYGSHHIEISYCEFSGPTSLGLGTWSSPYGGVPLHDIWIHDNVSYGNGGLGECPTSVGGGWQLGIPNNDYYGYNYTFENNIVYDGGHNAIEINGHHTVLKNNYFRNYAWLTPTGGVCNYSGDDNGKYGHRNVEIYGPASPAAKGQGLTVNITASGGAITGLSVNNAGYGYTVNEIVLISRGTSGYGKITSVGANGAVTGISIEGAGTSFTNQTGAITTGYKYNLLEGNRSGWSGQPAENDGNDGFTLTSEGNIMRYNASFRNGNSGMMFKRGTNSNYANNNRVYNNTFFSNGRWKPERYSLYSGATNIKWYISTFSGNVVKNNILNTINQTGNGSGYTVGDVLTANWWPPGHNYLRIQVTSVDVNGAITGASIYSTGDGYNAPHYGLNFIGGSGSGAFAHVTSVDGDGKITGISVVKNDFYGAADSIHNNNTITNNYCSVATYAGECSAYGDPKFINTNVSDKTSQEINSWNGNAGTYSVFALPNFRLQASSPAIDQGVPLTTAVGAGTTSTTLVVADALYFQDGTWGAEMARGVTLFPDWIAIGTVGNIVQISSINYSTNTITLASAKSWSNGASIWLYKKSDGTQVLYGTYPDIGAHEYLGNTYWVDTVGGAASWAACNAVSDPGAGSRCKLDGATGANTNAQAGDTVYLVSGVNYTTATGAGIITPAKSGTLGNPIHFTSKPGSTAKIVSPSGTDGILLQDRDYIKISNIDFTGSKIMFFIGLGSDRNEITGCTFAESNGAYSLGLISCYNTAFSSCVPSTHNWIHHNTFTKYGNVDCDDGGTVRIVADANDQSYYNTIENNTFSYGGHDTFDLGGKYNVIKNNVFHNEEAYFVAIPGCSNSPASGYFGDRNLIVTAYSATSTRYNLIEGNRLGYAGTPPDDDGSSGIENAGEKSIHRYNYIFGNGGMGFYFKSQNGGYSSDNRVYNNTIYYNGYGDADLSVKAGIQMSNYSVGKAINYGITYTCIKDLSGAALHGPEEPGVGANWTTYWVVGGTGGYQWTTYYAILWVSDNVPKNNVIKNNIVYNNATEHSVSGYNTYTNNLNTNPVFDDTTMTDKTSLTQPRLQLTSSSTSAINQGTHLTTTANSGSGSTALKVVDALYFQDGTWGSDLARTAGTMQADYIAIGTVGNYVKIASVNYTPGGDGYYSITLDSPMTWSNGASVWLYKKSDGTQVLYGTAPDIGAYEYPGLYYWVSPTGAAATWESCLSATALSGTSACSLTTALSSVSAGNTVMMRGGDYNAGIILSYKTGTSSSKITFQAYSTEVPVIKNTTNYPYTGRYFGLYLYHSSYVKISGIKFEYQTGGWFLGINAGSSYNEVDSCIFDGKGNSVAVNVWKGNTAAPDSDAAIHNWLHNNEFKDLGSVSSCSDDGGMQIGVTGTPMDHASGNNTIENNYFHCAGGHHNLETFSLYNVIRNNFFTNAGCYPYVGSCPYLKDETGEYGNRNIQLYDGSNHDGMFNLLEGNRFGPSGQPPDDDGGDGMTITAPKNIIRYNDVYASQNNGVYFKGGSNSYSNNNRFYNNTVTGSGRYYSGSGLWTGVNYRDPGTYHYGTIATIQGTGGVVTLTVTAPAPWVTGTLIVVYETTNYNATNAYLTKVNDTTFTYSKAGTYPQETSGMARGSGPKIGNVVKNNIFYTATNGDWSVLDLNDSYNTYTNNLCTATSGARCSVVGNPLFVDGTSPSPGSDSPTDPNLSLSGISSPAINTGTRLTTATNSGTSSTSLTVADSLYFQDGTWGSDLTRTAGTMQADWIAIGTVGNIVQISSITPINYSGNTITLASPMTWSNGASVWLYKKSDGTRVLYDAAPDIGAHEYTGAVPSTFTLSASKTGAGTGTVNSVDTYIDCGGTCSYASYSSGTSVTVYAGPTAGSIFTGWSGGGCSGTAKCTFTISADTTVTANFNTVSYTPVFPLKYSPNGNYLVDQNNTPFFWMGDSPWSLSMVKREDVSTYLNDRQTKGYTAVLVNAIEREYGINAPANEYGALPFTGWTSDTSSWATPNETYWVHIDYIITQAKNRGIAVFLDPTYSGWRCNTDGVVDGWCQNMINQTTTAMTNYGNFLGNRYKTGYDNILWWHGTDAIPTLTYGYSATHLSRINPVANAIKTQIPAALQVGHALRSGTYAYTGDTGPIATGIDSDYYLQAAPNNWYNIQSLYIIPENLPTLAQTAYQKTGTGYPMPIVMGEGIYANQGWGDPSIVNLLHQAFVSYLGGVMMHQYGNSNTWMIGSWPSYPCGIYAACAAPWSGSEGISATEDSIMGYVTSFFKTFEWWKLVPDYSNTVVTSSKGTSLSYKATAQTSDKQTTVVWNPAGGSVTVNMASMASTGASAVVRTWNPQTNVYSTVGTYATSGTQTFSPSAGQALILTTVPSGTTSWGATTSATESTKRTFLQDWTCYLSGGTPNGTNCISLSGDAEKVSLNAGDYAQMTSCVYTGSKGVRLEHNKYASTPNVTMKYRTSTSQALCEAAGWSIYSTPFQSQGYIGIRVEK